METYPNVPRPIREEGTKSSMIEDAREEICPWPKPMKLLISPTVAFM